MSRGKWLLLVVGVCLIQTPATAQEIDMSKGYAVEAPGNRPGAEPWPPAVGTVLVDDFDRPDGGLGSDWTVRTGSCGIIGNEARCNGNAGIATHNFAFGDSLEADVASRGSGYAALVLNWGGGTNNLFIKVQSQGGGTAFTNAACYLGNNGSSFGLGFFSLSSPFTTARMSVSVDGNRDVTITFSSIDGGAGTQQYVCTGAPAAEGEATGIAGWKNIASLDNFAAEGVVPVELESFSIDK